MVVRFVFLEGSLRLQFEGLDGFKESRLMQENQCGGQLVTRIFMH